MNGSGQVSVWEMDRNTIVGGGPVADPGPSSKAIETGDFNNDGKSDILMQNTSSGQVSVWEMDGNTIIGGGPVANPGTSWHAIGTGAGGSDILLQNISGQTSISEMDGAKIGGGQLTPNPGPSWHAIALTWTKGWTKSRLWSKAVAIPLYATIEVGSSPTLEQRVFD